MLVADLLGKRTLAKNADRRPDYVCPNCRNAVILKAGRQVVWHFAHKPPTDCNWAKGETREHLEAKQHFLEEFRSREIRAEVEFIVNTLPGDRRADVMLWSPNNRRFAIELQHTNLSLEDIEARAQSYARAGIAQIWIPFLHRSVFEKAELCSGGLLIERYAPRPFERWVHGFHGKNGMWMYAPHTNELWHGFMVGHQRYVQESNWYEAGGEEMTAGGYSRWSKRYKDLTLHGPYSLSMLRLTKMRRRGASLSHYSWPDADLAYFEPR